MTLDDAREWYQVGACVASSVIYRARMLPRDQAWWPRNHREASVLSHAMAMQWAMTIPADEHPQWLCMGGRGSMGGLWGTQKRGLMAGSMLGVRGIGWAEEEEPLLDLVVLPRPASVKAGLCRHTALLTMESELQAAHRVRPSCYGSADDYARGFFKLLWLPSPRRLFVARVGVRRNAREAGRIEKLRDSLDEITRWHSAAFAPGDQLVLVILAESAEGAPGSSVKVIIGGDTSSPWGPLLLTG